MNTRENIDYERIAKAIGYIKSDFKSQPALEDIAAGVALSPAHFQRMFTAWVGISPKKFLQYISLEYAKKILKEGQSSLFDAAYETGLSGTGRLHDLFVNIEGMTPGEYSHGGKNLRINYSFGSSPFGDILVAATSKGICFMSFAEDKRKSLNSLREKFPNAEYAPVPDIIQQRAMSIFKQDWSDLNEIKLHLKGTEFQLKVWETLLKIPMGELVTYGDVALKINNPKASRAVGTAIGENPVAFLIPCHRVIRSSGEFGGYHWGIDRKATIIGWEAVRISNLFSP
ncbi:methylated-DNA--protein-cysteine methyltransferase [Bacteroidia bacterium]|nr:methylated-DNA--protein-cysteine methyltransferase [Bacteroidia bacterium]